MKAARAAALADLAQHEKQTWETYGVPARALTLPMMAPSYRTIAPKWEKGPVTWRTPGAVVVETTRSLGVTLAEHLAAKRAKVARARDLPALSAALAKAKDAVVNAAIYLWARGEARGRETPENLARIAKKAESLARFLDKRGDEQAADRQRARAAGIRARLEPAVSDLPAISPTPAAPVVSLADHRARTRSAAARQAWETIRAKRASSKGA